MMDEYSVQAWLEKIGLTPAEIRALSHTLRDLKREYDQLRRNVITEYHRRQEEVQQSFYQELSSLAERIMKEREKA